MPYEIDAAFLTEPFLNIDRGNHLVATDFFTQKCEKESVRTLFLLLAIKELRAGMETPGIDKKEESGFEEVTHLCGALLVWLSICNMLYGNGNRFGYGVSKDHTADCR